MANRNEIIEDLALLADRDKVNAYVANLDRQAELAKNLNLNSKQEEVTEVAEEVVQEETKPELVEDLAKALVPILKELKALRQEVNDLKNGTIKSIGDSPKASLEDLVKQYITGETTEKAQTGKPNIAQFNTPVIAKTQQPTDIFGALDAGVFNKSAQQ